MIDLVVFLILAVSVMGAVGFMLHRSLLKRLCEEHPSVFEAMGSPGLVFHGSPSDSVRFSRFIFQREYSELGDARFTEFCDRYRNFARAYGLVVVATVGTLSLIAFG